MKAFIKLISLAIFLSSNIFIYSQVSENPLKEPAAVEIHHMRSGSNFKTDTVINTMERQKVISINFGGGLGLLLGPMLTVNAIAEITDEFHFSTGADFYLFSNSGEFTPEHFWQMTAIPYYVWRAGKRSIFRIGIGVTMFKQLSPYFSFRYDLEIQKVHNFGTELKVMSLGGTYIAPVLMLGYGYRIVM